MVSEAVRREIARQLWNKSIRRGICPKCGRKLTENVWGQKRCEPCDLYGLT